RVFGKNEAEIRRKIGGATLRDLAIPCTYPWPYSEEARTRSHDMTFSIAAFCPRIRELGCALATSSMAAGGRVPFVAPGVGVVLSQARSDPRLGLLGLRRLEARRSAEEAVEGLADMIASTPHSAWRQLGVVDREGGVAVFTGDACAPAKGARLGQGVLAIGNGLANDAVVPAMLRGFEAARDRPLSNRLLM